MRQSYSWSKMFTLTDSSTTSNFNASRYNSFHLSCNHILHNGNKECTYTFIFLISHRTSLRIVSWNSFMSKNRTLVSWKLERGWFLNVWLAKVCIKWERGKCTFSSQYKIAIRTVNIPVIIEKSNLRTFPPLLHSRITYFSWYRRFRQLYIHK